MLLMKVKLKARAL
jgi:hypothetical protein